MKFSIRKLVLIFDTNFVMQLFFNFKNKDSYFNIVIEL